MPEENEDTSKAGITTPLGSLSFSGKKMAEFISVILLCLFGVMTYAFFEHNGNTTTTGKELTIAIKELATANLAQVREQRVMNCLLTIDQKDRQNQLSNCERIAK